MNKILIPPVFFFGAMVLIIGFYFWAPGLNGIGFPFNLSGVLLIVLGFGVMGSARGLFKKHRTSLTFKRPTYFVQEGIYQRTRNPIYLGMVLMLLGLAICMGNGLSMGVVLVFFGVIHGFVAAREERMMLEAFGEEYRDYQKRVRRWI